MTEKAKQGGYYVGAECIVSVPTNPVALMIGSILGGRVDDSATVDNGKIVILKQRMTTNQGYACKVCKGYTVNLTPDTYWVVVDKSGADFQSHHDCDPKEAIFLQQHLIPIGGTDLLSEEDKTQHVYDAIDIALGAKEKFPQPAN